MLYNFERAVNVLVAINANHIQINGRHWSHVLWRREFFSLDLEIVTHLFIRSIALLTTYYKWTLMRAIQIKQWVINSVISKIA